LKVARLDGLPEAYYNRPAPRHDGPARIQHADTFFASSGASIVHGGTTACYVTGTDNIHTPCIDLFRDAASYYVTVAHEYTHWTKHQKRLACDFGRKRWVTRATPWRSLSPNSAPRFYAPIWNSRSNHARVTPAISKMAPRVEEAMPAPSLPPSRMRTARRITSTACSRTRPRPPRRQEETHCPARLLHPHGYEPGVATRTPLCPCLCARPRRIIPLKANIAAVFTTMS
jgi:hypothetical protein